MLKKIILFLTLFLTTNLAVSLTVIKEDLKKVVYIDPGHGGYDGGCVSYNKETIEKNVTLDISLCVKKHLESLGYKVLLTRDGDYALGNTKKKDIYGRVDLINESNAQLYLCIHANSFTSPQIKGAQTFYSSVNEKNADIASAILSKVKELDPTNNRVAKEMKGKYLMDHVNVPGCLIEVGFLTNMEDLNNLTSQDYIENLSLMISIAINEVIKS